MGPSYFPLRWESTGDKWWYASPIDWAAAAGLYDLVRELLRLDGNHLIKLTSLRRIRRLEAVWDDEEQFHDVAKCRCEVAHQLFDECEAKKGKNSLISAGYGGWLLYTAASAGDLGFVELILERDPLLVFGEGEYGVTDILYAAARSKNVEVFRVIYGFAISPRFVKNGREEEGYGEIPEAFKWEVMNRAAHAAARGGNLEALMDLLGDSGDVLGFRVAQGSTILHAAAARGQVEVVEHLVRSYEIVSSTNNEGNTALHVAAYSGRFLVVEALIHASPSSISVRNKAGETFLHMAVTGFQTPGFRRLDQQIELMKQIVTGKLFNIEDIINAKNNEGRTALHLAIIGNFHSNLVQLLMSARYVHVNARDDHGMTPLDYLRQQPRSASSEILIRQLISAGGISSCSDYDARKSIASLLKMQGICSSPGTSFQVSDNEIFSCTGIVRVADSSLDRASVRHLSSSTEVSHCDLTNWDNGNVDSKKPGPIQSTTKLWRTMFHWPMMKKRKPDKPNKMGNDNISDNRWGASEETPIPLRERFSKPTSLLNNKRTLAVRSNISSPTNRKRFASGVGQDVLQDLPHIKIGGHSQSSSFSKTSHCSQNSVDKGKAVCTEDDTAGPSCSNQILDDDDSPNLMRKQGSIDKRLVNHILCFGASGLSVKNSIGRQQANQSNKRFVQSVG